MVLLYYLFLRSYYSPFVLNGSNLLLGLTCIAIFQHMLKSKPIVYQKSSHYFLKLLENANNFATAPLSMVFVGNPYIVCLLLQLNPKKTFTQIIITLKKSHTLSRISDDHLRNIFCIC